MVLVSAFCVMFFILTIMAWVCLIKFWNQFIELAKSNGRFKQMINEIYEELESASNNGEMEKKMREMYEEIEKSIYDKDKQ